METYRQEIENDGVKIPCIMVEPSNPIGAAIVIHGYGGCKEEQLGLAWRVAEVGLAACVIDLRGHGQNGLPLGREIVSDVEAVISYCRRFGKVVAIGHSLGGRLALASGADYAIGISPAIVTTFGDQERESLKSVRSYRVRDSALDDFLEVFKIIPEWQPSKVRPVLIIYAARDIPDIISACKKINQKIAPAIIVEQALHSDVYLNEITFGRIDNQLRLWLE